jgi:SAM-dependent methyltransferase
MSFASGNQSQDVNGTPPNSQRGWRLSRTTQDVLSALGRIILVLVGVAIILLAWFFPYDTDVPLSAAKMAEERDYYAKAFAAGDRQLNPAESPEEERYVQIGKSAALGEHIEEHVRAFVTQYGLPGKKVLDVGSGRGYLQDMVEDYTGLDISTTAARFYHKKFVLGSATSMPFADNSFDAIWSIWVLEHVPNPEQALEEIRRVAKDGSLLYLSPAWDCQPYLSNGYNVRPYSDFDLSGKLTKFLIPARLTGYVMARRLIYPARYASWKWSGQPTRLHYHRLDPNYTTYWGPDADAVNSLDAYEMGLWFRSRGDECLNCAGDPIAPIRDDIGLIVRVHKSQ